MKRRLTLMEDHSRHQNLKSYGLEESKRTDGRLSPDCVRSCYRRRGTTLPGPSTSIALVPRSPGSTQTRGIIIRFLYRHDRDRIWKISKDSAMLRNKHLKFAPDRSPEVREKGRQLNPAVGKAREENCSADFGG